MRRIILVSNWEVSLLPLVLALISLVSMSTFPNWAATSKVSNLNDASKSDTLKTELSLKDVEGAAERLRSSTYDLVEEVQRDSTSHKPELTTIESIAANASPRHLEWEASNSYAPLRKKWLDFHMMAIKQRLSLLHEEMSSPQLAHNATLPENWHQANKLLNDLDNDNLALEKALNVSDPDHSQVGQPAINLYNHAGQIEKAISEMVLLLAGKN